MKLIIIACAIIYICQALPMTSHKPHLKPLQNPAVPEKLSTSKIDENLQFKVVKDLTKDNSENDDLEGANTFGLGWGGWGGGGNPFGGWGGGFGGNPFGGWGGGGPFGGFGGGYGGGFGGGYGGYGGGYGGYGGGFF